MGSTRYSRLAHGAEEDDFEPRAEETRVLKEVDLDEGRYLLIAARLRLLRKVERGISTLHRHDETLKPHEQPALLYKHTLSNRPTPANTLEQPVTTQK
jgi:hypothetical protein